MNAPGLIRFLGPGQQEWQQLTTVISNATRGSNILKLADASQIKTGMWISLTMQPDKGNTLYQDLNSRPAYWKCAICVDPVTGNGVSKGSLEVLRQVGLLNLLNLLFKRGFSSILQASFFQPFKTGKRSNHIDMRAC